MQRLHYIDNLKAIAIICVVLGHVCSITNIPWMVSIIYSFHMALFFSISSCLIALSDNNIDLRKKTEQLLIPYMSISFVAMAKHGFSSAAVSGYLMSETRWGYWFLPTLFLLFVLIKLVLWSKKLYKSNIVLFIISIFVIECLLWVLKCCLPAPVADFFCMRHLVTYWPFFILGYLYKKNISSGNVIAWVAFCIWILVVYTDIRFNFSNEMTRMCGRFAAVIFLFGINKYINKCYRYFTDIGKASLSIYLFHYFLLSYIGHFMDCMERVLLTLLGSALIISACCVLHYKIIVNSKILSLLFMGKYKKYAL